MHLSKDLLWTMLFTSLIHTATKRKRRVSEVTWSRESEDVIAVSGVQMDGFSLTRLYSTA